MVYRLIKLQGPFQSVINFQTYSNAWYLQVRFLNHTPIEGYTLNMDTSLFSKKCIMHSVIMFKELMHKR